MRRAGSCLSVLIALLAPRLAWAADDAEQEQRQLTPQEIEAWLDSRALPSSDQGAATAEIARNIQQAAAGTQNVSNNIVGVSNAANQTGETASDVLQSSDGLAAESEALSNEVGRFLARIKAA